MTTLPPETRLPPQNLEAEESVLGAMLVAESTVGPVLLEARLDAEDFYRERHRIVFRAIIALFERSEPVDVLTATEELRGQGRLEAAGGRDFVATLASTVPAAGNARHYAQIVKQNALLRRLLQAAETIQHRVHERSGEPRALVEEAERLLFTVAHERHTQDFRKIGSILEQHIDRLESLSRGDAEVTGTPSGFRSLDGITGGFQPGNLIVIAARPSMGKSALVANIAESVAVRYGRPVAFFSLEMSEAELAQRFIACRARISGERLRKGQVAERDWEGVVRACNELMEAPLWIDDSSDIGMLELRAKARKLHGQMLESHGGLGLVIVDYLQLMRPEDPRANRVEQVGQMSRGLKILARELEVPVIGLSQLSRAPEQRPDKRPILSDLRECVTGDTLVTLADGRRTPIASLVGETPVVLAADGDGRIVEARSGKVWPVGVRPVLEVTLASGRFLRCTDDHRILTLPGWKRVSELRPGGRVAIAREIPEPSETQEWPDFRVALLGQLIGDGSYLSGQPMRYTSASTENSAIVAEAARTEFGATVRRYEGGRSWHQLLISGNGNRWAPAGVNAWLRELGIFGQRSHEKRVPEAAFRLPNRQIGLLLRHLWATDGSIWVGVRRDGRPTTRVFYGTNSRELARDVAALLLRVGIVARIGSSRKRGHRVGYHVDVSGAGQARFLEGVGAFGPREPHAERLAAHVAVSHANTNVDTLPIEIFSRVKSRMAEMGVSQRQMAAMRGTSYGGTSHFGFSPSREMVSEYALLLEDEELERAASSDLFWDTISSIEPTGEEEVFDLTVPGPASWLADGIVSHNSGQIEQDSDLVAFIYRDEYYNPDTEDQGLAEIIIAKHRNGPVGKEKLVFLNQFPKFADQARQAPVVEQKAGEGPPLQDAGSDPAENGEEDPF